MRHMHGPGGRDRHAFAAEASHGGPAAHHHHRPRRRPFDYGALRLVVLGMIAEAPRHGYELMKEIEERMGGAYSPSPGLIYPTLAWLEDMGYAVPEAADGRKSYRITAEGAAFLAANRPALDALAARMGGMGGSRNAPVAVVEAMAGLKRALRARFTGGAVDPATVDRIAAALRAATLEVEMTMPTDPPATGLATGLTSVAVVGTPKAAGYAAQLCKHFAHKVPARFEGSDGEIAFAAGSCRLHAGDDALTLTVAAADPAAIAQLQNVVASHLVRFAFRENLAVDWQPATPAA